jgi:hypothetical protein
MFLQQNDKLAIKNELFKVLHIQVMKEITGLTTVSANAVIEIRNDLGIQTDKTAIKNQYRETIEFIEDALPKFIEEAWCHPAKKAGS